MTVEYRTPPAPAGQVPPTPPSRLRRWFSLASVLIVTLLLASAWLVFPYLIEGRNLLEDVGDRVASERSDGAIALGDFLTKEALGPGDAEVAVLFATDTFFDRTSTPRVAGQYELDKYLVFIVTETVHISELPQALPVAELVIDGQTYSSIQSDGPVFTDHHRSTTIQFDRFKEDGSPVLSDASKQVAINVANSWDEANTKRTASWDFPIAYPDTAHTLDSPIFIMALSAGLLSATLTPCLLQLIVVYMATITGLSAEQMRGSTAVPAEVRRKMLLAALAFIAGFMAFYTASGALIGYAGKAAQIVFAEYSRVVAIGSGILVIAMGLWMGIKARAPLVCHLPAPNLIKSGDSGGYLRSALLAAGFSLGCMVCFSGAIIATLFIYVGAIGSAPIGALILFVFSLGVAIPFLAAAFFLSRTISTMNWISRYSPQLSFVSMLVIIGFGLVLVTDNFHTVSDIIYPWLNLN